MSAINGKGHGDAHDWMGVSQGHGYTGYQCRKCPANFVHGYHTTPDIFEEMKSAGVPLACRPPSIPDVPTAVLLEALLMPNGEVMCGGKSIGYSDSLGPFLNNRNK